MSIEALSQKLDDAAQALVDTELLLQEDFRNLKRDSKPPREQRMSGWSEKQIQFYNLKKKALYITSSSHALAQKKSTLEKYLSITTNQLVEKYYSRREHTTHNTALKRDLLTTLKNYRSLFLSVDRTSLDKGALTFPKSNYVIWDSPQQNLRLKLRKNNTGKWMIATLEIV